MAVVRLFEVLAAYSIGIFWSHVAIFGVIIRYLKDPFQQWGVTVRTDRPQCLKSSGQWTHNLVTLQHDGIKLHYVSAGSHDKPLMVFLHGFPESWYSWRHQLEFFKNNYHVVALSMRGYGDSDAPAGVKKYAIPVLLEDVKGFIRSLGADDCILVAHDWGGALAWQIAMDAPELVSKLIVLNIPHPNVFRKHLRSSLKQFLMSWYVYFFQLPWIPEFVITRCDLGLFRDMWRKVGLNRDEEEVFLYLFSQPGALTGPINYYRAIFRYGPSTADNLQRKTKKVEQPTLLIWGTDDVALSEEMAAMSAQYADDIKIKKIAGGSHFIQQHRPDDVNAFMDDFLREK